MNINIVKTYGVALTAFCICSCSVNTQTQKNEYIVPGAWISATRKETTEEF